MPVPITVSTTEESLLIRRAQYNDAEAFAELYRLHAPALFRYFLLWHVERSLAEDLTAEVFVKMIKGLSRFRDQGIPLAAWLFRIAHDRLVDQVRLDARRPTTPLSDLTLDPQLNPEKLVADSLEVEALMRAVGALPEEQKLVIQLRFIEGYSLEVVAQIMHKTVGAVKSLQHRALSNLGRTVRA
ncbi:MAG: RNA polymerase sigma factor [Anaerolineales bacterium]